MDELDVSIRLNGDALTVRVDATTSLAELLRNQAGLTGTKVACGEGTCGACTVLVDGAPTLSCILLAAQVDGADVRTVEGLSVDGELSVLQRAFIAEDAFQCGFCTPGQLASATALLAANPTPTRDEIRHAMAGQPVPVRHVSEDRARRAARVRGLSLVARLVRTQVEMEGRFEDRWVLVEPDDHIEPWPDPGELAVVGRPAPRLTGPRRVSGAARFVSDISLPGMLEAVVVRSPHAHARVELDLDAARAVPGVLAVAGPGDTPLLGRDAGADGGARVRGRRRRRACGQSTRAQPRSVLPRSPPAGRRSASSSTSSRGSPISASPRTRRRASAATSRPDSTRPT